MNGILFLSTLLMLEKDISFPGFVLNEMGGRGQNERRVGMLDVKLGETTNMKIIYSFCFSFV